MISSVIGGLPRLLPNAALRVQVSLSKIVSQGVNDYVLVRRCIMAWLAAAADGPRECCRAAAADRTASDR